MYFSLFYNDLYRSRTFNVLLRVSSQGQVSHGVENEQLAVAGAAIVAEPITTVGQPLLAPVVLEQHAPFFLTYNLQGMRDTLMVGVGQVDVFV